MWSMRRPVTFPSGDEVETLLRLCALRIPRISSTCSQYPTRSVTSKKPTIVDLTRWQCARGQRYHCPRSTSVHSGVSCPGMTSVPLTSRRCPRLQSRDGMAPAWPYIAPARSFRKRAFQGLGCAGNELAQSTAHAFSAPQRRAQLARDLSANVRGATREPLYVVAEVQNPSQSNESWDLAALSSTSPRGGPGSDRKRGS